MPTLHIDLQDGFIGDPVVVRVNGEEVFRHEKLMTRPQLGLAKSVKVELPKGRAEIEISMPTRKQKRVVETTLEADKYVGVSFDPEKKELTEPTVQDQLFGYV